MTIHDLILVTAPNTEMRVHILGAETIAGKTGARNTAKFVETLTRKGYINSYVTMYYPLYHAHEVYVECLQC